MSDMTVEEKVGQLFMVAAWSNKDQRHLQELQKLIAEEHIGGICIFQGSPHKQVELLNALQESSEIPLMVASDAEWGPSMRLDSTVLYPRQLGMGAIRDDSIIYQFGREMGRQLKLLGVHINFAPVIDVNNNSRNPVIGDRSFGEDRNNVALKGLAYAEGLQDAGILACGKHFPGHGDTDVDSHHDLPVIPHSWERLDSLELYPFKVLMTQGLGSIMTAHLNIPSLDTTPNHAASISKYINQDLLRDSLGFTGLVFSDALNMQGVAKHHAPGELELAAFLAGNDVLLYSEDIPKAAANIRAAVASGKVSMERLDESVERILRAKAWLGLDDFGPTPTKGVTKAINDAQAKWMLTNICESRLTLLRDQKDILPFGTGEKRQFVAVDLGISSPSQFQKKLLEYGDFPRYQIANSSSASAYEQLLKRLSKEPLVVVGIHGMTRRASKKWGLSELEVDFIQRLSDSTDVLVVMFGSPYALELLGEIPQLMISYDYHVEGQRAAARAIFGEIPINGQLPVSAGPYKAGEGLNRGPNRMKKTSPEDVGVESGYLERIDSVIMLAIRNGATPGCRVLIARDSKIFFDRSYGHHTYSRNRKVLNSDIYDLASITKIAATTLAMMKLDEMGLVDIDDPVQTYLPETRGDPIASLKLRDLLTHQSGLQAWIPFYVQTLNEDGTLRDDIYRASASDSFGVEVAEDVYMLNSYQDSVWDRLRSAELRSRRDYKYSDLGFYIMRRIVEAQCGMKLDQFVAEKFYEPMGLSSIGYLPLASFPKGRVVPTEEDGYFRQQLLQGHVHDMGAAMMGGVEGHAGLFSDAYDLAALMQMLMNGGVYGGQRFLDPGTIEKFTSRQSSKSRRGLGFDKPELDQRKNSPTSLFCSPSTFGHSGFTGTCTWADPELGLVYVFLSNRVHPDMENRKLIRDNVRTHIQDLVYDALGHGCCPR